MPRKASKTELPPSGKGTPQRPGRLTGWFSDERRRVARRCLIWIVLVMVAVVGTVSGLRRLERNILNSPHDTAPQPVRIKLADCPDWMPRRLIREIAQELRPASADYRETDLARQVYDRAAGHPWIRKAHLAFKGGRDKASDGVVELRAEYRMPIAWVQAEDGYLRAVDQDGYVLPPAQVPQWVIRPDEREISYINKSDIPADQQGRRIHYITITGVTGRSPGVGRHWPANGLADGLKLAKLIYTRPYATQINVIDVGRAPFLRMYAQVGTSPRTEILFGRFPVSGGDHNVPTADKLDRLDGVASKHGGMLAGLKGLDLRLDYAYVRTQ